MGTHSVGGTVGTATAGEGYAVSLSSNPAGGRVVEGHEEAEVFAEQVGGEQTNAFCLQAGVTSDTHTEYTR